MYRLDIYRFLKSNEYEYKFVGKFGKKGETRGEREKPTPEQMEKQNQRNRENKVRRKMKANFGEGDYWTTLKYPRGTKKRLEGVKEDLKGFLRRMRGRYQRRGHPLKYIWRIEISKRGSPHIHILINRIPDVDILIRECWQVGGVDITLAYEEGGFAKLAAYIVKLPEEGEVAKMAAHIAKPQEEGQDPDGAAKRYGCSKNLVMPEPEHHTYKRRTLERMVRDGIEPTPGFYIDPGSVWYGTNPYTGYTYLKYIEYKLPEVKKRNGNRDIPDDNPGAPPGGRVMVLHAGGDPT